MRAPRPSSRRRPSSERGGAVVEFAIVLPLFVALLFGTIDYAWYLYQKFTLASAVQSGIRAALAVKETDNPDSWQAAVDAAKAALAKSGAIAPLSVTFGPAAASRYTGTRPTRALTLTGHFTFTPLVGLVPMPTSNLVYSSTMLLDAQNASL
jgi:Flp pilus assembly protein TadG